MLAVFGIGQTELLIIGLICCFLVLPIVVAVGVVVFVAMNKSNNQKPDS